LDIVGHKKEFNEVKCTWKIRPVVHHLLYGSNMFQIVVYCSDELCNNKIIE
jgi:hypothetical protein